MNTNVTVPLSPETFTALQQLALATGRTPSEEAAAVIEQQLKYTSASRQLTEQEAQEARERFERHFGSVDSLPDEVEVDGERIEDFFGKISFGYDGATTNEQIDADLAREYGRTYDGD
jgi:predicted transcriptional regulator